MLSLFTYCVFPPFLVGQIFFFLTYGYEGVATASLLFAIYYFLPAILLSYIIQLNTKHFPIFKTSTLEKFIFFSLSVLATLAVLAFLFNLTLSRLFPVDMTSSLSGLYLSLDSSFHISLIKSIMHDGISSTGLHPEQYHRYHFATHYFDALIFRVLDLNIFTEYSKLGVIKALSFVPLTIIFCKNHHTAQFAREVFFNSPCIFYDCGWWGSFSSYPLWLPSLSLILSWPYVMRVMEKPDSRLLVLCFLITIFTYFGKVSAGFSFSVFVCSMLLLKHYREYKAWVFKISSFVFLMIFYLMFWRIEVSSSQTFSFTDLSYSIFSDAVFSIIIVIIVTFMSSFSVGKVIGVCLSFATVSISAVAASNSDNDVYYFMQSLTFILSLYVLSLLQIKGKP